MRLPRAQFTVRGMMVAVAIAAILSGAEALRRRSGSLRSRSAFHRAEEATSLLAVEGLRVTEAEERKQLSSPWMARDETTRPMDLRDRIRHRQADRVAMQKRADWHGRMAERYAGVAARPWLSVASGPAEPPIPERVRQDAKLKREFNKFFDSWIRSRATPKTSPGPPSVR